MIIVQAIVLSISACFFLSSNQTYAASKNVKAHKVYKKKIKAIKKKSMFYSYKYMDVSGDGTDELLILYHPKLHGSGDEFRIYAYVNKKVTCICSEGRYGLNKITAYKKTKSLITYYAGHGGESYSYWKMRNGKFKNIASKGRQAVAGGGDYNGSWNYNGSKGSAAKYNFAKQIKGIKKGKKRETVTTNWPELTGDQ